MTGWLILAAMIALVLLLLWRVGRLDRSALLLAGAAMCVAAAGYARQGEPGEPGAPAQARDEGRRPDTLFMSERQALLEHFGETGEWLATADAMNRFGENQAAVSFMESAVAKHPRVADLWIGLAHALFVQSGGNVRAPAVQLAFARARAVAGPNNPAPDYFEGLAYLETGDPADALAHWQALDQRLPAGSPWHKLLGARIGLLRAVMGASGG